MNNNTIPHSSSGKLYVAHSVKEKSVKKDALNKTKATQTTVSAAPLQPYQYTSRSYYYDSMGGGYQGL